MTKPSGLLNRRDFAGSSLLAGAALASAPQTSFGNDTPARLIRTGVIGCGSVSQAYLVACEPCICTPVCSWCRG
jgi:hypothetical protein